MSNIGWINNVYRSETLPPMHVTKKVKDTDKWKKAVLDAFEHLGVVQFRENLEFYDYYRMVDNDISYQEMSEVMPQLSDLEDLLDGVGIPTFIKHYDLIGLIIRAIVGKYIDIQNKFHVTDTGEVAENEFLRFKNDEINKVIKAVIDNRVNYDLAKRGMTPEGQQFESEEEQQQFMAQMEQERLKLIPPDLDRTLKTTFKSKGRKWGEATIERDRELFEMSYLEKEELKDKLISGRYFREYVITGDSYKPERWSPKNTFFSKETGTLLPQKGEYVGRLHFMTPAEVEAKYGHEIDAKTLKGVLGGNEHWKSFTSVGADGMRGVAQNAYPSSGYRAERVPFSNFYDHNFSLGLEDQTGIPLGEYTDLSTGVTSERFLPRMHGNNHGMYSNFARVLRDDFVQRKDLCQVTEVYFRAYDLIGYLTYENEFGAPVTEIVTEDILEEFLKERGIKKTFTESREQIIDNFEVNTLKWVYKPFSYEGVKISSPNLKEPIYLYCRPTEFQIKGDSDFEVLLPVGGYIGKSFAKRIAPYQAAYNLCMNQITSLLEKEIGMFFLFDVNLIPSEYQHYGDVTDSLIQIRNLAKDIGFMPVATSGDAQKDQTYFNQFAAHDVSFSKQIANRVELASFYQSKAYEAIGLTGQMMAEPTKYETASGVKVTQEASFAQISEIYEDFEVGNKGVLELHLNIAQFAQSTGKDNSLFYTKSDASIEFLKISDPDLPFRRIGLLPASNSKKRKELEDFKTYLMQTNTLGADTLEIASLISSDVMSEALEITRIERERRQEQEELNHKRNMELQQQEAQNREQEEIAKWERIEASKERDRQARKDIEYIKAAGIASGDETSNDAYEELQRIRNEAREDNNLNRQYEKDAREFNLKEGIQTKKIQLEEEKLKLKAQEIRNKSREIDAKIYTSEINKN